MKFFIVLCLASMVFAQEQVAENIGDQELARAKQALDELTYSKEEHIYNVEGYVEGEREVGYENDIIAPCKDFTCKVGWECIVDRITMEPYCDCAKSCPIGEKSTDEIYRTQVCSTTNTTFTSLCEFHRQKCLDPELTGVVVDFYGPCSELPACSPADIREYPERMTGWFVESMFLLMDRSEEHGGLTLKEKEILQEPRSPEAQAIFWKFRRLDTNPADLFLDFFELEALRAPLVLLEPCTKPFLQGCDVDQDSLISAVEFGYCLNLSERDIEY